MDSKSIRSFVDLENETIQKQRRELQLLAAELRDCERELNDTVATHHQQLVAWDSDRRRAITLNEKCSQLERELQNRNDEMNAMKAELHIMELQEERHQLALRSTQEQLGVVSDEYSHALLQQNELKEQNLRLVQKIEDIRTELGRYDSREQEVLTVLTSKDIELSSATAHVSELRSRLKIAEASISEHRGTISKLRKANSEVSQLEAVSRRENENLLRESRKFKERCDEQKKEIHRLKLSLLAASNEITLSGETDKRKTQLLELQKSRQEWADAEVATLRELYKSQQKEMFALQLKLDSVKDRLAEHQRGKTKVDNHTARLKPSWSHDDLSSRSSIANDLNQSNRSSTTLDLSPIPTIADLDKQDSRLRSDENISDNTMLPEKESCITPVLHPTTATSVETTHFYSSCS